MQAFLIVSCFSLFIAVQSLAIEQRSCATPDVVAIAQQVSHPHYFCNWYLSEYVVSYQLLELQLMPG